MGGAKVVCLSEFLKQRPESQEAEQPRIAEASVTPFESYQQRIVPHPLDEFCVTYDHMPCFVYVKIMQVAESRGRNSRMYQKGQDHCRNECHYERSDVECWMAKRGLAVHGLRNPEILKSAESAYEYFALILSTGGRVVRK